MVFFADFERIQTTPEFCGSRRPHLGSLGSLGTNTDEHDSEVEAIRKKLTELVDSGETICRVTKPWKKAPRDRPMRPGRTAVRTASGLEGRKETARCERAVSLITAHSLNRLGEKGWIITMAYQSAL